MIVIVIGQLHNARTRGHVKNGIDESTSSSVPSQQRLADVRGFSGLLVILWTPAADSSAKSRSQVTAHMGKGPIQAITVSKGTPPGVFLFMEYDRIDRVK